MPPVGRSRRSQQVPWSSRTRWGPSRDSGNGTLDLLTFPRSSFSIRSFLDAHRHPLTPPLVPQNKTSSTVSRHCATVSCCFPSCSILRSCLYSHPLPSTSRSSHRSRGTRSSSSSTLKSSSSSSQTRFDSRRPPTRMTETEKDVSVGTSESSVGDKTREGELR